MRWMSILAALVLCPKTATLGDDRPAVIVVVGAEGSDEYAPQFRIWAARWQEAAKRGLADCVTVGLDAQGESTDRELLEHHLAQQREKSSEPLWLVLIGHGTFDGKTAKFSLRGPDITAAELSAWLKPLDRPLAVINCASCSGPFVTELSGPNRVVVASTRSGHEYNFVRFGDYFSASIADSEADLDKDQQTSLFEAFLLAADKVREFYAGEARLMTEHAILDDNGDRLGTPADWFQGLRPVKEAQGNANLDGALARQFVLLREGAENELSREARIRRDDLERQLAKLRQRKFQLEESEYFALLEPLLVEIARLYQSAANE